MGQNGKVRDISKYIINRKLTSQINREKIYYLINGAGTTGSSFGGKVKFTSCDIPN